MNVIDQVMSIFAGTEGLPRRRAPNRRFTLGDDFLNFIRSASLTSATNSNAKRR